MSEGKWKSDAERPEMNGIQYHIRCKPGDTARYVLLPGDPNRVDLIAATWDESHKVANNREHRTFTGTVGGVEISACSTGVGGPSASNAIEELARIGSDTFIRVGTCGALQAEIECGDMIVNTASVRHDGTSHCYIEESYPAAASYDVTDALIEACERLNLRYHVGISCSTASFYCGQARPGFRGFTQSAFEHAVEDLRQAKVLNYEMEAATLFTLSGLYNLRAGCVCTAVANRITHQMTAEGVDRSIEVANLAVQILAQRENLMKKLGRKHWYSALEKEDHS